MKLLTLFIILVMLVGCIQESPPITKETPDYIFVNKGHYECKTISQEEKRYGRDPNTYIITKDKCVFIRSRTDSYSPVEISNKEYLKTLLE